MKNFNFKNAWLMLRIHSYGFIIMTLIIACKNFSNYKHANEGFYNVDLKYKLKRLFKNDTIAIDYKANFFIKNQTLVFFKINRLQHNYDIYFFNDTLYIYNNDTLYIKKYGKNRYIKWLQPLYKSIRYFVSNKNKLSNQNDTIKIISKNDKIQEKYFYQKNKIKYREIKYLMKINNVEDNQFESFSYSNFQNVNSNNYDNFKKLKDTITIINLKKKFKKKKKFVKKLKFKIKHKLNQDNRKYENKYYLYELWHSSCYPCLLSIKDLTDLSEKYKEKIKVIGINNLDSKTRLKKTIEKYQIKYNVYIVDSLNIPLEYPTYLITTKNNTIIYKTEGYSPEVRKILDSIIKKL